MNEELLQLAYSKFETDADYETFKADLLTNEDLQRLAYSKFETDADFETFRSDLLGEKKNPSQNVPSGESPSEVTDLDSSASQTTEDGSSDLSDSQKRELGIPYGEGVDEYGVPTYPEETKEERETRLDKNKNFWGASFWGGMSRLNEAITSIPNTLYDLAAYPQNKLADLLDLPEDHSLRASSEKFEETIGVKNSLLDYYQDETKKYAERKGKFIEENYESGSIYENIKEGNYNAAFDLLGAGTIESAPVSIGIMASGGTFGVARTALGTTVALTEGQKNELRQAFPDATDAELMEKAVMSAAAESVFSAVTTGSLGSVYKDIIKREGKEVGTEIFRKGLVEMYKKVLKKYGAPVGAAGEGLEEAATQITQNLIAERDPWEGVADAFILGTGSGAVMSAPINMVNATQDGGQQSPEGATIDLDIEGQREAMEERIASGEVEPLQVTDNETDVIDENAVDENVTSDSPDTQATEQLVEGETDDNTVLVAEIINEERAAGKSDEEIIESLSDADKNTAEIILQREQDQKVEPVQAAKESKELANKARQEQKEAKSKNLSTTKRAVNKAVDMLSDRQGSVKRKLKAAGFSRTIDYMVAKLGASSYAKNLSDKAHARTFDRLSQEDARNLEEIILNRRIIAIDQSRSERGLAPVKHQGGKTKVFAEKALEGYKQQLGEKKYNQLVERADAFFDEYKNLLKTMNKEGLISQETYDIFAEVDYQPTVYLDFLKDMEGNFMNEQLDNFETSTLSQEQIKSMRGGYEGSQSVDSQGLLQRSILARAKAVFSNRVNKAFAKEFKVARERMVELQAKETLTKKEEKQLKYLKELDDNVKVDKIVGFSETTGKPQYAMEKMNKDGWKAIYHYENGVANRIWMKKDFHEKYTDTNNQILNASSREVASKVSGTRLVKTFATGENPLFLITNIPRDLAFALTFSKEYGNGYKTVVPVELVKLLKDFGKGAGQALAQGRLYDKYMEYGGGMDFLTIQGRYGKEGIFNQYVENKVADKLADFREKGVGRRAKDFMKFIRKINTASEFATRIAVFDRSIQNQLKELGVKDINALTEEKQADIYTAAVRSARELTDFNQGGKATKALDAAMPYLNAATQGTRSAVQNTVERPVETTSRLLQVAGGFTALTMTAAFSLIGANRDEQDEETKKMSVEEIYFETLKGVSAYDLRNYYIFPTGTKNAKGEWNYYRVAKAQALSPFINTSEHYLRKFYAEKEGINYEQDLSKELTGTINQNILPIGYELKDNIGRVPLVDAYVATLGIDAYTENPLDWKRGKIPAELEGITDDRVEGFYKKIGEEAGISPVRLKSAVESFITTPSTNPYIGFGYMGAEYLTSGEKKDAWADFKKAAGKRMFKSTSEYNRISKVLERVNPDIVDIYRNHLTVESEVRKAVKQAKADDSVDQIDEVLNKVFKDQPDMAEKAVKWAKSELEKKKLNPFVNTLKFERNKDVRAVILAEKFGDALLKSEESYSEAEKQIVKELVQEKVLDSETYKKYAKLVK